MYRLLCEGCITEFNVKKAVGEKIDLRGCDPRGLDLQGWMPMGWTSTTATFVRRIFAVSIVATRG